MKRYVVHRYFRAKAYVEIFADSPEAARDAALAKEPSLSPRMEYLADEAIEVYDPATASNRGDALIDEEL